MASNCLRRTLVLACLAVVVSGYPQAAWAEDRQLFMLVTDLFDQPLLDIRAEEVDLQMAGAECTIKSMHLDAGPMKVALLVDNSYAARQSLIPLRAGLSAFLDALPPEHEVGLFTIAYPVRRRVDFTTDRDELKDRATSLFADLSGTVYLDDGLVETWERWFDDEDAWPVFVTLVYGGAARSSVQMEAGLLRRFNEFVVELRMRAATVHAVLVSTPSGPLADATTGPVSADSNVRPLGARRGGVRLSTFLTRKTGGTYRALAAATALPNVFKELGTMMGEHHRAVQHRYRVVYECVPDKTSGRIGAGVMRPNVLVRLYPDRRPPRLRRYAASETDEVDRTGPDACGEPGPAAHGNAHCRLPRGHEGPHEAQLSAARTLKWSR